MSRACDSRRAEAVDCGKCPNGDPVIIKYSGGGAETALQVCRRRPRTGALSADGEISLCVVECGQSQFAAPVWVDRAASDPIRDAQQIIEGDPAADHNVAALARRVGMSERHFARRFAAETGLTPGRYVQRVRIDRARDLLEAEDLGVDAIARRVGLGTAESLRRTFHRHFGTSPQTYRARFARDANPSIRTTRPTTLTGGRSR